MTKPARIEFPWTKEADATLIRMRAEKAPFAAIAAKIGCSVRAAEERSYQLRKQGIEVWVGNTATKKTPEAMAKLRDMIAQGKSTDATGAQIGISEYTARRWLLVMERDHANPIATPAKEPDMDARKGNIIWTAAIDAKLIGMRNAQSSWDTIGSAFGVAQSTVYNRALVLRDRGHAMWGAPESVRSVRSVREDGSTRTDLSPMPALHPVSWGAVCEPWEVFHARVLGEGDRA